MIFKRSKSKSIVDYMYSNYELGKYKSQDWKEFIDHLYKIKGLTKRDYGRLLDLSSTGMVWDHILKDK